MAVIDAPKNIKAFLDMIATAEGTAGKGDDGYNVTVSGDGKDHFFTSYAEHPQQKVKLNGLGYKSDAAGRYQIMSYWWFQYKGMLGLPDFSPLSQDKYAIQMIKECRAYQLILDGKIEQAITACKSRWASLPGAGYGQRELSMSDCLGIYQKCRSAYDV